MTARSKLYFLCVGAPKCGTTWLNDFLNAHSEIYTPGTIKEVHYFDRYYSRGEGWYHSLFEEALPGQKKGEITPHYLYLEDCTRIYKYNPDIRLILIFRDPVKRCVSHYKYRQRLDNYKGTFTEFLRDYPVALEWGKYGKHLSRFLEVFSPTQVLILNYEKVTKDTDFLKSKISSFLDVDPAGFPKNAGKRKSQWTHRTKVPDGVSTICAAVTNNGESEFIQVACFS